MFGKEDCVTILVPIVSTAVGCPCGLVIAIDGIFDGTFPIEQGDGRFAGAQSQFEIVDPVCAPCQMGRHFGEHVKAEILECRDGIRQMQRSAVLVDLEPQAVFAIAVDRLWTDLQGTIAKADRKKARAASAGGA